MSTDIRSVEPHANFRWDVGMLDLDHLEEISPAVDVLGQSQDHALAEH